jgi:hypothetical protein
MTRLFLILGIMLASACLLTVTQSRTASVYLRDISTETAGTMLNPLPSAESQTLRVHIATDSESKSLSPDRLSAAVDTVRDGGSRAVACRTTRGDVPDCKYHRQARDRH